MTWASDPTTHVARRKLHVCDWCGERIEIGETYRRYRYLDGAEACTTKAHPECFDEIEKAASEEGGWFEWTPGDFDRPLKAAGEKP